MTIGASTRARDSPSPTSLTCLTWQPPRNAPLPGITSNSVQITYAMSLLQAGVDTSVIALWLGHAGVRSTDAYVHADISIKEKALALTTPTSARPGRYRPTDKVLAFLDSL